jgi:hypothetical protein
MKTKLPIFAASLLIILTACSGKQVKVAGEAKGDATVAQADGSPKPDQQQPKQGQQSSTQGSTPANKPNQTTGAKKHQPEQSEPYSNFQQHPAA